MFNSAKIKELENQLELLKLKLDFFIKNNPKYNVGDEIKDIVILNRKIKQRGVFGKLFDQSYNYKIFDKNKKCDFWADELEIKKYQNEK